MFVVHVGRGMRCWGNSPRRTLAQSPTKRTRIPWTCSTIVLYAATVDRLFVHRSGFYIRAKYSGYQNGLDL